MGLLERERELAALGRAIESAARGEATSVLLLGPAGIGKTQLILAAEELGRDAGLHVLRARGADDELAFAHGIVRQLFTHTIRSAGDAAWTGPAAVARSVLTQDMATADRFAVMNGFYWLLANLAEATPLLLLVDDLHWCDEASAAWLRYALRRLEGLPVAMVLAARPYEPGADLGWLSELSSEKLTETLEPAALSAEAVKQLTQSAFDTECEAAFSAACHHASAGNPYLLGELLRSIRAEGLSPTATAASFVDRLSSPAISRSVLIRLRRLGREAIDIAHALAILGPDATLHRAALITGVDEAATAGAADAMHAAGILDTVDPVEFTHPVVRTAVYQDVPPARRALLHGACARQLADEGVEVERIAAHLHRASPTAERWVTETLLRAAAAVRELGLPRRAVELLERALAEPPPPDLRKITIANLGRVESVLGLPSGVEHLREVLALAEGAEEQAELAADLASALLATGRTEEALTTAEAALAELSIVTGATDRLLLVTYCAAQGQVELTSRLGRWEPRLEKAAESAYLNGGGRVDLRMCLVHLAMTRGEPIAGLDHVAETFAFESVPDEHAENWVAAGFGHTIVLAEHVDAVHRTLIRLETAAARPGSTHLTVNASLLRGQLFAMTGDLRGAEAELRATVELAQERAIWAIWVMGLAGLGHVLIDRGALDDAERLFAEIPPAGIERLLLALTVRGRLRLARGQTEPALADLLSAGARASLGKQLNPAYAGWRVPAVRALAAVGRVDEARKLSRENLRLAMRWGAAAPIGIAERSEALIQDSSQETIALLRKSVATLQSSPAVLELARSQIALGSALRRANKRVESRGHLREGLDLADRCGALGLADDARTELLATGARPRRQRLHGVDALTPSELRVARLVAAGLTNRQVAEGLYVTVKTVEDHLGAVYRKLDIRSRRELSAALSQSGSDRARGPQAPG